MRLAIDLGAAKAACLFGTPEHVAGFGLEPIWSALGPSAPLRSLSLALASAEAPLDREPLKAVVSVSSPDLALEIVRGETRCQSSVDAGAARRALLDAIAGLPRDRALLHVFPSAYAVDGEPVADPRGRPGRGLSAQARIVTAPVSLALELRERLAQAGVALDRLIAAPYAAGLAAPSAQERARGVVVIDLGASRTGIAAFHAGVLAHLQVLPIGQDSVTRALALRLGCSEASAEHLKVRRLSLAPEALIAERVEAGRIGQDGRLEPQEIARVALAEAAGGAIDAIFAAAADALSRASLPEGAERWGAVLAGGGARLPGIGPLAQAALARPVRLALGGASAWSAPEFAAAYGALRQGEAGPGEAIPPALRLPAPEGGKDRRLFAAMAAPLRWLRDNF